MRGDVRDYKLNFINGTIELPCLSDSVFLILFLCITKKTIKFFSGCQLRAIIADLFSEWRW